MSKTRSNADMANKLAFDSIQDMVDFASVEDKVTAVVRGSQGGTFVYDSTNWLRQSINVVSPDDSIWSITIDDTGVLGATKQ